MRRQPGFFPSDLSLLRVMIGANNSGRSDSVGGALMGKFIVFTFLMLGWAFYELSGGSDFEPQVRDVAEVEVIEQRPAVTRSSAAPALISLNLPALDQVAAPAVNAEVIATITPASAPLPQEVVSPEPAAEPVAVVVEEPVLDLRAVAASRVNMRAGPGTNFDVLNAFDRGTEAEVLLVDATGWAQIRILQSGEIGWMAERLLTDS